MFGNFFKKENLLMNSSHKYREIKFPLILCFVILIVFSFFKITPLIFHQIEQVGTVLNAEFHGLSENDITFNI